MPATVRNAIGKCRGDLGSVIKVMDKMLLILPLLTVQTGVRGDLAGSSGVSLPSGNLGGYSGVSGGYQQNSVALTGSLSRSGGATHDMGF